MGFQKRHIFVAQFFETALVLSVDVLLGLVLTYTIMNLVVPSVSVILPSLRLALFDSA